MTYDLKDFSELCMLFSKILKTDSEDPLSCLLYESNDATRSISSAGDDGDIHIAEACNIAGHIQAVEQILSLPSSDIACADLSEMFLLSLDVLREYIRAALPADRYLEMAADRNIRAWSGFIKHPKDYVFAHRCFSDTDVNLDPSVVVIDSDFLKNWEGLSSREKDQRKMDLAHRTVTVELPSIDEVSDFFGSCAKHINDLIALSTTSPPAS